jgi:hypothetical protein
MKALVKRATQEDLKEVIANIREADKEEIESASGLSYEKTLERILDTCDDCWAGFADGDLIAIFGVHVKSSLSGYGIPWMISTKKIEKHGKLFLRYCRPVFERMCVNMDVLVNYVHDRNDVAKMWLKWLGFDIKPAKPYGAKQELFCRFELLTKGKNYV